MQIKTNFLASSSVLFLFTAKKQFTSDLAKVFLNLLELQVIIVSSVFTRMTLTHRKLVAKVTFYFILHSYDLFNLAAKLQCNSLSA